jgi:outer membrane protein assembly factor BamB
VAVFEYREGELVYKNVFGKTPGINVGSIHIRDFFVDYSDSKLYLAADSPKVIACLDINTGNLLGYIGQVKWEDYDGNPDTPGGFSQVAGVALTPDGRILVCDYNNNRVQQFPKELCVAEKVELEYEGNIPPFKHVEFVSNSRLNFATKTVSKYKPALLYNPPDPEIVICGLL